MKKRHIIYFLFLVSIIYSCNNSQKKAAQPSTTDSIEEQTDTISMADTTTTPQYDVYCNTRYNYCISYPSAILIPQGESDSGDGQIFLSDNGVNELRVYRDSRPIVMEKRFDIEKAYIQDTDTQATKREITYRTLKNNYYVISGFSEGKIFYQKTIYRDFELVTAILTYDKMDKHQYDTLIEPIFGSLK